MGAYHRSSKSVDFIALNDGSTIKNVQVVVDPSKFDESMLKQITTGSCINVNGELVESQGAGQTVELQCREIEIYGLCASDYPMQKKGQSFEYMRQYAHLRLRTNTFGAVMRIRHNMAIASTSISTITDFSISTHRSSLPATVRVQADVPGYNQEPLRP